MSKFNVGDIVLCKKKFCEGYFIVTNVYINPYGWKCVKLAHKGYSKYSFPVHYENVAEYCEKQSVRRIQCSERDFKLLERMHGIGCFYHDISPLYEKLCSKPPKFVIFRNVSTKQQLIFHLGKATKVLKRIGFEHNENYEQVRVVKPMVKLQFIGEL